MKKYMKFILLGIAFLFNVLIFATMAGKALSYTGKISAGGINLGSITVDATTYELLKGDKPYGLAVACLVLVIVGVVAQLGLVGLEAAKMNKYNKFIALFVALVLVVTGILFFCFATGDNKGCDLGVGVIFSAIFAIAAGAVDAVYALKEAK